MPALVFVSVLSAILFLLIGWISTIRAAFRSERGKGLRLLAILPLTTPIALLVLAFRDFKAALSPLIMGLLAVVSLPFGGYLAATSTKAQLASLEARLKDKDVSIQVNSLIPAPGSPEDNIWEHPLLRPLAEAAALTPEGESVRERLSGATKDAPLAALDSLKPSRKIDYLASPDPTAPLQRSTVEGGAFHRFHRTALAALLDEGGTSENDHIPTTWLECGQLVLNHYRPSEDSIKQLEQAIQRPNDHYPYEREKGFAMLLPHLSHLKNWTQTSVAKAQAAAAAGNINETFRMIHLGLQLSETGDSDLLISRLVQFAQVQITLDAIRVAQQLHIGTEEDWAAVQDRLDKWDFPSLIAASLNAERAFGSASILPLTKGRPSGVFQSVAQLSNGSPQARPEQSTGEKALRFLIDNLVGGNAQAILVHNWHQAIEAYEDLIANVNATYRKSRSEAWNQCELPPLPRPLPSYGILAKMLLPALDSAFRKSLSVQHQLEMAKLAIALERFYVAHLSYPESLPDLTPSYQESAPRDPMTGEGWSYQRLEEGQGFVLYSKGPNGRDDGGHFDRKTASKPDGLDDASWAISPNRPHLPQFVLGDEASLDMSPEMQQRYGLKPTSKPEAGNEAGPEAGPEAKAEPEASQ